MSYADNFVYVTAAAEISIFMCTYVCKYECLCV